MRKEKEYLTILFADISRSRQCYLTLGDERGQKLIADCLALLVAAARRHQGELIKTIGDEILCVFPLPDLAVEAAMDMHQSLARMPFAHPCLDRPGIHVGLQAGMAVRFEEDIYGDTVNVASRLTALAKTGQILTTEQTISQLRPDHQARVRGIERTSLKGQNETYAIHEVVWEQHDLTVVLERPWDDAPPAPRLKLSHQGLSIDLDHSRPEITLGRHISNDIQVDDIAVSRIHARIECRKGKFVLVDQSTNGTFVSLQGGKFHFARRDEIILKQSGFLGLGRHVACDSPEAILFIVCSQQ